MANSLRPSLSCSTISTVISSRRRRINHQRIARVQSNLFFGENSFEKQGDEEQVITFLTANGFVQLPFRSGYCRKIQIPRREPQEALPTLEEQGLCIGASFTIAATNGVDPTRRLHLLGFCRSVHNLSDVVEDAVLQKGGSVMLQHIELKSGLHEILKMTVAIPLLNGVPPEHEYLRSAISSGGGIVEKTWRQWQIY